VSTVAACVELWGALWHNRLCTQASAPGRNLHFYVVQRLDDVQELAASPAWAAHYRRHDQLDALWRHRGTATWRPAARCCQAFGLLAWALLISPHCDIVLAVGSVANALSMAWRLCARLRHCCRRKSGPVTQWIDSLEDDDDIACAADSEVEADDSKLWKQFLSQLRPESEEETEYRVRIETMRLAQET